MRRIATVIAVNPETIAGYKRIHADVWPDVLRTIAVCNIRNYTIFLREPENLLFGTYEYHGTDHAADMAKMAADPMTQKWWAVCMPMQVPLPSRAEGEWWASMEEVFHQD